MKILQKKGGFTKEELMSYKYIVYGNCVTQMKVLVNAANKLNVVYANRDNEVSRVEVFVV